ncbi:MAG: hypothetical protein IKY16_02200 [Bacteroidales bacterium]|jgi:hypothetical protein|nr:hypothetical protein [Bacteroidales bacterium]
MEGFIDIKKLTLDELAGVVNLYPWFGGARKELCERMSRMGGDGWGERQFADAAMYVGARERMADMMRSSRNENWADADVEKLLKSYIVEKEEVEDTASGKRKVYAGVGDYFSQDDYDQVRRADDNVFSKYAAKARQGRTSVEETPDVEFDMYTETLAGIYLEQGYPEQAKRIYSKLILAYPEKNAYFAALIQKIDELNKY